MSEVKRIATRESYGQALVELGKEHDDVVVLDADLANATKTSLFRDTYPERHIDCGIAEANMIGVAAGIAASGMVPYASTFAMFAAGRAYEQIRNSVGYPHLNVKIAATHAGISVGEDGATHQCIEDLALMRAIPGMTVLCPADDTETKACIRAAYELDGPVYIRLSRMPTPILYDPENYSFEIGKGIKVKEGTDVTIIATGIEVPYAVNAADLLEKEGISCEVLDLHTIKPLDEALILRSAGKTGRVVTVEEHSVIGGLGSAVSDSLSAHQPTLLKKVGIYDTFGESGKAEELLHKYGLDAEGIAKEIRSFLQ